MTVYNLLKHIVKGYLSQRFECQLKAAGFFKYMWPLSGQQALKGKENKFTNITEGWLMICFA